MGAFDTRDACFGMGRAVLLGLLGEVEAWQV